MKRIFIVLALCAAWSLVAAGAATALTYTCSTVVRRDQPDPLSALFKNRYDSPAINSQGDVVFVGYPKGGSRRLYLYPSAGGAAVAAAKDGAAPGGGTFQRFRTVSINDAAEIAFHARLAAGEGVFVGPASNLAKAAVTGDASPGGGVFEVFPAQSRVNPAGDVAFAARVANGPSGVFRYAASTATVATVALAGDGALDGRLLCELLDVGLGPSGAVAVRALTKSNCADTIEPELVGVYLDTGSGFAKIALEGDTAPSPAENYAHFIGAPDVNASDKVLFRAHTTGVGGGTAIFLHDPAAPMTTELVATGDAAPVTGGSLKMVAPAGVSDVDRAVVGGRMSGGLAKTGIFVFDAAGADEKVVATNDPAPADVFGPNSIYLKINPGNRKNNEGIGADRSGTWVAYTAKVKDTLGALTKSGVFRCQGS